MDAMAVQVRAERRQRYGCLTTACSGRRCAPPLMPSITVHASLNFAPAVTGPKKGGGLSERAQSENWVPHQALVSALSESQTPNFRPHDLMSASESGKFEACSKKGVRISAM